MAIDEEIKIHKNVELYLSLHNDSSLSLYTLFQDAIEKGIQIEKERIRKQVEKDKQEVDYDTQGSHYIIETKNIDIWDD